MVNKEYLLRLEGQYLKFNQKKINQSVSVDYQQIYQIEEPVWLGYNLNYGGYYDKRILSKFFSKAREHSIMYSTDENYRNNFDQIIERKNKHQIRIQKNYDNDYKATIISNHDNDEDSSEEVYQRYFYDWSPNSILMSTKGGLCDIRIYLSYYLVMTISLAVILVVTITRYNDIMTTNGIITDISNITTSCDEIISCDCSRMERRNMVYKYKIVVNYTYTIDNIRYDSIYGECFSTSDDMTDEYDNFISSEFVPVYYLNSIKSKSSLNDIKIMNDFNDILPITILIGMIWLLLASFGYNYKNILSIWCKTKTKVELKDKGFEDVDLEKMECYD